MVKAAKAPKTDVVTRLYTINLHKRLHKITFKERAPRAIREIKKFAIKALGTKDVRVDTGLNKFIWKQGIRNVPFRVRVKLARRRNEDEEATEKLYTLVTLVEVDSFKGLQNASVDE
ncbi:60s ribosomal protein l31 [Nannochloropsis oceanica]